MALKHNWVVEESLQDVLLVRFSFMGDPAKRNSEGDLEVLFGWLDSPIDDRSRETRKYLDELRSKGAKAFLVHVSYCEKLQGSNAAVFHPRDVVEFFQISF